MESFSLKKKKKIKVLVVFVCLTPPPMTNHFIANGYAISQFTQYEETFSEKF